MCCDTMRFYTYQYYYMILLYGVSRYIYLMVKYDIITAFYKIKYKNNKASSIYLIPDTFRIPLQIRNANYNITLSLSRTSKKQEPKF